MSIAQAHSDAAFAHQYLTRFVQPRRDRARAVFQRSVERGEIPNDTWADVALDLVCGALCERLLNGHAPLNDRFVASGGDLVLQGVTGRVRRTS
jgi:hypothetical protein